MAELSRAVSADRVTAKSVGDDAGEEDASTTQPVTIPKTSAGQKKFSTDQQAVPEQGLPPRSEASAEEANRRAEAAEAASEAAGDHSEYAVTAETRILRQVQAGMAKKPVVKTAQGMSFFGEHAGGWLAIGLIGVLADRKRRKEWATAAVGVAVAHAASVAVKRVVRRRRPSDPGVQVLVGTPSRLSFPSSHATSTTAAAVLYGGLLGRKLTPALVPPMMLSRLVLGVHYPTDVMAGSALGGVVAMGTRRFIKRISGKKLAKKSTKKGPAETVEEP